MPALLYTVLAHTGTAVYRTDTCRHCCVRSGIQNPYLSSNVRCVLLQEPPAQAGNRKNCTHITAHKAHSLSLALLLCRQISTLTVHNPTIKFLSTRALLRCIRAHTGGTCRRCAADSISSLVVVVVVSSGGDGGDVSTRACQ